MIFCETCGEEIIAEPTVYGNDGEVYHNTCYPERVIKTVKGLRRQIRFWKIMFWTLAGITVVGNFIHMVRSHL